jgi:nucleotide-binding universal stress UspA family protein
MTAGPVMLATLAGAPPHPRAVELAVEVARDHGARLVIADVLDQPVGGRGVAPALPDPPELAAAVESATAEALAAGVRVTVIRGPSVRPVATLLELVHEHRPRLLVFAPDPARLSRRRGLSPGRHRRALRSLEQHTGCLIWAPATSQRVSAETIRRAFAAIASLARGWPGALPRLW